jgi:hypothetical protein
VFQISISYGKRERKLTRTAQPGFHCAVGLFVSLEKLSGLAELFPGVDSSDDRGTRTAGTRVNVSGRAVDDSSRRAGTGGFVFVSLKITAGL